MNTTSDHRAARIGLAVGVPALSAIVAYVPFLAFRSELPDRVATHFGASGRPDGSMTIAGFLLATGALMAVGVVICFATAVKRPSDGALAVTGGFLGGFLAGIGAGIVATTSVGQRDLTDWRDASGAGWMLLVMLVIAVVLGTLGARLAASFIVNDEDADTPSPVMELAEGEEVVWMATARSKPMLLTGLIGVVLGLSIGFVTSWMMGAVVLLSSVAILALSTLQVRADRRGLRVRYGRLPWPVTNVELARIEQATVIDVRPMEWGGWGYRGSLKLMRRAAVVHRAGPGLRLDLVDGKVFAVTVDDSASAAALLNTQIARRSVST